MTRTKTVLHVGCGADAPENLHPAFRTDDWTEIRLDIDPNVLPDIRATITNMAPVPNESVDAVFSAHNLEHLYPDEVPTALHEFRRVLRPDGIALITVPDLQSVAALVATGQLDQPAYLSALGPVAPIDMLFGFRPALAGGNRFMAHHTGFVANSLLTALTDAGFAAVTVQRVPSAYALWAVAFASPATDTRMSDLNDTMLPLNAALRAMQTAA